MIFLIGIASSAYYVTDPTNCPNSYQSQTCSGSDLVCGYSGGVTFCYDMGTLNAPVGSTTTTGSGGTNYGCSDTTCDGGFVTDCYAYDGSSPFCDNGGSFWCDRKAECYNKHVQTTCTGGVFASASCSATCTTNYFQCDGDTTDGDGCEIHAGDSCGFGTGTIVNNQCYSSSAGNCTSSSKLDCNDDDSDGNPTTCNGGSDGCEITIGGSCSVGELSGTYSGVCSGSSGTCVVSKSYFETGTNTQYQTNSTENFLWGTDYGSTGWLIHLNNTNNGVWGVNASGCIQFMDGSHQCSASTNGSLSGDLDMQGYQITNVGKLVMQGVILSEDIIPIVSNLYSLGNSTNIFKELFVGVINSETINSQTGNITNLNSENGEITNLSTENGNITNIDSTNIQSQEIGSSNVNITSNLSVSGYTIKEEGGNLVIELK